MSRNIVLCCDGTANEFAKHNTNVVKLYAMLQQDPATQVTYYHPGLGTLEPAGALTPLARRVTKLMGLAFGYGLPNDIRDAYVFLMRYYQPGDRLFMFGFSRGAYTVRAVAALLRMYGLIRPGNEPLVPYAIRMMMGIERAAQRRGNDSTAFDDYFTLAADFKASMSCMECKPHFVGVWDTVSSVGWIENPLKLPYVANNPDIAIGRHAVAIDERRAFFRNHLWRPPANATTPSGPRNVLQVWFPGVHCDVGGGYPEAESGLSKGALRWMLCEAEHAGLLVDAGRRADILGETSSGRYVAPNAQANSHESLRGFWNLAELVLRKRYDYTTDTERRRMNLWRRRWIPDGSFVHASAFARGTDYTKRLPDSVQQVQDRWPNTEAAVVKGFPMVEGSPSV
jgi:uncharacterized protein (DUF2235 family)